MESSVRGEEHPEGDLGEDSHVVEVPRTQASMASAEWSRQGAKEMRSEILIKILVVQSTADLLRKLDLILNSTEAIERFLRRRVLLSGLYFKMTLASVILTQSFITSFTYLVFFYF